MRSLVRGLDYDNSKRVAMRERVTYQEYDCRRELQLPSGKRVAVWFPINLEHYEYIPNRTIERNPWPRVAHPDVWQYSYRDFGNRVGIWRLLRMFRALDVRPTIALNSGVLRYYPELGEELHSFQAPIMAHGRFNTEYTNGMPECEERGWLRSVLDEIESGSGIRASGWLGPGVAGTDRTPDLLAEFGLKYQAEWVLDDQPTRVKVRSGRLLSLPYSFELNDSRLNTGAISVSEFLEACGRQLDVLVDEEVAGAKVMAVPLHSFISGQAHIYQDLSAFIDELTRRDDVWLATGDEIADWFLFQENRFLGRESTGGDLNE